MSKEPTVLSGTSYVPSKVLVFGVFDILHLGHLRFLRRCAELGEVHVGLLTEELAATYKRNPVQSYEIREATLLELPWVAAVHEKTEHDGKPLLRQVNPDFLAVGSDYTLSQYLVSIDTPMSYLEALDVALVFFPNEKLVSTTRIIEEVVESV